jgi:cell division protein FtsX
LEQNLIQKTLNNPTARMWFGLFMISLVVISLFFLLTFNAFLHTNRVINKFNNEFNRVIEFCDQNLSEQKKLFNKISYCRMAKEFKDMNVWGSDKINDSCFYDLNLI